MFEATPAERNVLLVADPRSPAALRVSRGLVDKGFRVERVAPGQRASGLQLASVFLLEAAVTPKLLRGLLGCVQTPVLVLAATRDLAMSVVPLLRSDDDVATIDDTDGLAAWRLQRLIDRACGSGPRRLRLDALTALLSRHAFEQQLDHSISNIHGGEVAGLLRLNLDRFKTVNDRYGHMAGDRALRRVADAIRVRLSPGDLAGRLSGDEFAVLMRRPTEESVTADARHLIEAIAGLDLAGPPQADGTPSLTASGGLVFVSEGDKTDDLLVASNVANFAAKAEGRGRLVLHRDLVERLKNSDDALRMLHLDNSTKLLTERLVGTLASNTRQMIEEANRRANVCPLTGVYSKLYLMTQLPEEIEQARIRCRPLTVAIVDVDDFRDFNSDHGYGTGDRVLRAFGSIALDSIRSSDWIGRIGGDDFLVVMPCTSSADAQQVIERIRMRMNESHIESTDGKRLSVTISAAIAELMPDAEDAEQLIERASMLIKRAKTTGKNRTEIAPEKVSDTFPQKGV